MEWGQWEELAVVTRVYPLRGKPIVPSLGRCASLSSLPQLHGDFSSYHLFLVAREGSWRVSQVSCSQPWLPGTKQQVLKSHSPQEHLPPSLTGITNAFLPGDLPSQWPPLGMLSPSQGDQQQDAT